MRILITRTGGFAGISRPVADIDTRLLEPDRAREIEALVKSAQFFQLPPRVAGDAAGADFQTYEITIKENERSHQVEFLEDQSAATLELRRLLGLVIR